MSDLNDKVTIIIRSVGERTEQLCRELILAQGVAPGNVVVVRETPFSAAMRKSFEIGIERRLPWTFCVDADVLLRPGAVETMVRTAEEQPENVCEIQGYVLDKFFGGPRHGGVHLYRTNFLPKALVSIPAEGINIRPEFHTLETMKAQGHPYMVVPYLVGLHDFEQYCSDIFRKCFVQAHKHQQLTALFLAIWREGAAGDKDYSIALKGFAKGIAYEGDVFIDTRQEVYQAYFAELQLEEKKEIATGSYTPELIEQIITDWIEPEIYRNTFPTKMGLALAQVPQRPSHPPAIQDRLVQRIHQIGPLRIIPYTLGWFFRLAGEKIQAWAGSGMVANR